jgi:hypothetical protein
VSKNYNDQCATGSAAFGADVLPKPYQLLATLLRGITARSMLFHFAKKFRVYWLDPAGMP